MVEKIAFAQWVWMMWIDNFIDNEGTICRADIRRAFGTSALQAGIDLRRYMELNPRRIGYDPRAKTYIRIEGSKPLFTADQRRAAFEIVEAARECCP